MAREQVGTAPSADPDAATKAYVDAKLDAAVIDGGTVASTTPDTLDGGTP